MESQKSVDNTKVARKGHPKCSGALKFLIGVVVLLLIGSFFWFVTFTGPNNKEISKLQSAMEVLEPIIDKLPAGIKITSGEKTISIVIPGDESYSYVYDKNIKESTLDNGIEVRIVGTGICTILLGMLFLVPLYNFIYYLEKQKNK